MWFLKLICAPPHMHASNPAMESHVKCTFSLLPVKSIHCKKCKNASMKSHIGHANKQWVEEERLTTCGLKSKVTHLLGSVAVGGQREKSTNSALSLEADRAIILFSTHPSMKARGVLKSEEREAYISHLQILQNVSETSTPAVDLYRRL